MMDAAIAAVRPGADEVAAVWPAATEFGFENEMAAFGLQFGHGLGSDCTNGRSSRGSTA